MAVPPPEASAEDSTQTSVGEVEQVITGDESVRLHKEIVRVPGDPPLFCVRKHAVGGPTRPPVLLVHGFAQNRYSWHTSRRSLSAWLAAQGWDTWNLELRGHGRSRDEGSQGAERFDDYIEDVLRAQEALPGPAFWVGHSLGGTVLYGAATRPAARTLGIAGIGALYRFGQANWLIHLLCVATHRAREAPWMERVQVRTGLAGALLSRLYGVSDVLGYTFPISGWWPGNMEPEVLAERLERGFDWTSVKVWQEMSRWCAEDRFDHDEAWHATDVPLLVILGDMDHLMPPEDGRSAYDRAGGEDKTLVVFDDYRHGVHWGHLDLVLGRFAPAHVWPTLDCWMAERRGSGRKGT